MSPSVSIYDVPRNACFYYVTECLFLLCHHMFVFIMSPSVSLSDDPRNACFYYVTKWGRRCSVFNGQAAHPVIPCCGCPHQITIPNNNNLSFKAQSQIIIMLGIFLSKSKTAYYSNYHWTLASYHNTKIQKYKNTKIQKYKNTKIQKYKNTKMTT